VQILMDHLHTPVPEPVAPAGRPPIPRELVAIVNRCLAKKREERFADMDELLRALKSVSGEPPHLAVTASSELTISGGTPVSGVHTLPGAAIRASSSGAIAAPAVTGSDAGATPTTVSMPAGLAADESAPGRGGRALTIALVAASVLLAVGIGVVLIDPFGSESATTVPAPSGVPAPSDPRPVAAQPAVEPEPAPAPVRSVLVELDSIPPGATVRIGGAEYGPTPAQVELTGAQAEPGTELTFEFRAPGYVDTTVTRAVPQDGALEVSVRMRRVRRAPPRGESRRDAPEQDVLPAGYRESPY
ncbi:MAG TPA: PEGA domain-containing protein, partial [Sandaracinaceae bacterium]